MNKKEYGWAAYYRHAYEREKKKAAQLAGKLYETENKRDELRAKYERLTGGAAWKCLAPFRLARKVPGKIKHLMAGTVGTKRVGGSFDVKYAKTHPEAYREILGDYQAELEKQADPYSRWLAEKAPGFKAEALDQCAVSKEEAEGLCRVVAYADLPRVLADVSLPWQQENGNGELPELILFAESPDCLDADAPRLALSCMREHPEAVFWYGDEDYQSTESNGKHFDPYFKPDWSPETLLGFFYFGSYVGIRSSALTEQSLQYALQSGSCKEREPRELLYRLCLFIAFADAGLDAGGLRVKAACRTPLMLYTGKYAPKNQTYEEVVLETTHSEDYRQYDNYWGYEQQYRQMKAEVLSQAGLLDDYDPQADRENVPLVSVVIPSKDNYKVLKTCISSFLEKTYYADKKIEFLVVDNGSGEENRRQVEEFLSQLTEHPLVCRAEYLYEKADFNFSKMCNAGAKSAQGELLLFLNDDIEIIVDDWLKIMVGQSFFPGTGAVGAKLWYPECERIQHAGITNLAIGPSHKLITFPDDRLYYYGHGAVSMDMMAVTAACLLVKKSLFDQLGGLNENLAVAYNDVEFCFRLLRNGYRNVQRNDAVLCHHESLTRGRDDLSDTKWERLLGEKKKLYDLYPEYRGTDPYYSSFLSQTSPEYVTGYEYPYEDRLLVAECCKKERWDKMQRCLCANLKLTVDRVLFQRKFHKEEPDILMAEGWCYLPGADNALYTAFFLLHAEDGTVLVYPVNVRYRYDVCAILPHETNVGLAGFTCRVRKSDLAAGKYRAGLLYQHKVTGQEILAESESEICVTGETAQS